MPNSSLAPLSPGALRSIDPSLLRAFLAPHTRFLTTHGFVLADDGPSLDCDALYGLVSRTDIPVPEALADGLHHARALASADHMAWFLSANVRHALGLTFPDDATPAEIALRVWLVRPDLVERHAAESEIDRASTLTLFSPARALPSHVACSDAHQLVALSAQLAPWFEERRRGRSCEVFAVERTEGIWFVVARGDAVRCTATRRLDDDRPSVVRYRPEKHDLVLFRPTTGELGVRAPGLRLIDHYRMTFGAFLVGDANFFRTRAKFDLTPLAHAGRAALACDDFAGEIDWVRLVALTQRSEFAPSARIMHDADDLFAYFERRGKILHPTTIVSATFRVKFTAAKRPRTFSIRSASKVRQARDADTFLLEAWLRARAFIAPAEASSEAAA